MGSARESTMVVERPVAEVMTSPVFSVRPETPLQEAVTLLSGHHISGLPVVDDNGALVGELSEKDLMVRESGFDAGPYVMFLDAVIYLRNPLQWTKQVHQVLGSTVGDVMSTQVHTCTPSTRLPAAARLLNDRRIQRLFVVNEQGVMEGVLTRGDVVRALAETD
jgi:CBS-domain-containing membrane protein